MATSKKSKSQEPAVSAITLAQIVAAGAEGMFTPASVHAPLVAEGMVEINTAVVDAAGNIATRATPKGIEAMNAPQTQAPAAAPAPAAGKPSFAIETGVAMPAVSGRGRTANTYPFDQLEVGQSFFVPNSPERENAAKSMASTVSSATARYAVEVPGETVVNRKGKTVPKVEEVRKFVVRAVEENGIKGARIWRTK